MQTKSIEQTIAFDASPKQVYDLIMNKELHSEFTGGEVTMSNEPGGKFSVFDGYCTGYNIELTDGEKIVQAWHFQEDGWPEDHFSTCTFIFSKTSGGCQLDFTQTEIPEHKAEALSEGWYEFYWEPMQNYLAAI